MKARVKRFAVVQPVGRSPYRPYAHVHFRDNNELAAQLATYARSKWPSPQKLAVDVHAKKIIVDGTERASFSLHEYRTHFTADAASQAEMDEIYSQASGAGR